MKAFKAISAADSFYLSANLVPKAPNKYQILIFWYQAEAEVVDEVCSSSSVAVDFYVK